MLVTKVIDKIEFLPLNGSREFFMEAQEDHLRFNKIWHDNERSERIAKHGKILYSSKPRHTNIKYFWVKDIVN